ncbi:MAG: hypothetical protein GX213_08720 [Clostridiaceae bacterium]|nr:hypothetical protein [Clostridiaceae bacterium]
MAGLATGFWKCRSELEQKRSVLAEFVPQMEEEKRIMHKKGWHDAIKRALTNK